MLIVASYRRRHVRTSENWQCTIRFWRNGGHLNVLIATEPNIHRRVSRCLQQLGSWVLVEHSFTECSILFPFVASILDNGSWSVKHEWQRCIQTYNELFVADRVWELAKECHAEVVRIVALVSNDVLQQSGLMSEDLRQTGTVHMR